jgi:hypothetical protein
MPTCLSLRGRLCLSFCLLVALIGCGSCSRGEPPMSPTEVVNQFYRWHLGYPGNPLADRAYRTNTDLAESFIAKVDEMMAASQVGRADPFLLAQDVPERFAVYSAIEGDGEATVLVDLYWPGNATPVRREVTLRFLEGRWQITGVSPVP